MGLTQSIVNWFSQPLASGNPTDERYWTTSTPVFHSASGIPVSPEQAFRVSAFFQGVRLISETIGSLPRHFYLLQEDGSKETHHSTAICEALCHERINPWQTSQQWLETMTAWAIAYPQALSRIIVRPGGRLELWPIDPALVDEVQQLDSGMLRYQIRDEKTGTVSPLLQDEVFSIRGLGLHSFMGANLLSLCREAIGVWVALEKFESYYFARGGMPMTVLTHPKTLDEAGRKNVRTGYERFLNGLDNVWRIFVAEEGMVPETIGHTPKDAMMTEARMEQVLEICRWLNLPPHMLRYWRDPTKANAEQMGREYVDYTINPWDRRWGSSFKKQLIEVEDVYFEFDPSALLRGSQKERAEADSILVQAGIKSENEARRDRNLNPWPGRDEPRRSVNVGAEPSNQLESEAREVPSQRLALLAESAVQRVKSKEQRVLAVKAAAFAGNPSGWEAWLVGFFKDHAEWVAEVLHISPVAAQQYAQARFLAIMEHGLGTPAGDALRSLALLGTTQ